MMEIIGRIVGLSPHPRPFSRGEKGAVTQDLSFEEESIFQPLSKGRGQKHPYMHPDLQRFFLLVLMFPYI